MAENTQTLDAGLSIQQQYGAFGMASGGEAGSSVSPLDKIMGMLMGFKSDGKTTLFLGCHGALILNFDGLSTPAPQVEKTYPTLAQIWPARNKMGVLVGANGQPLIPDWPAVADLGDQLIKAAKANKPRPRMVIFDSSTAALRLLKDYVVVAAAELALAKADKEVKTFRNLEGRSGYDVMYDLLVGLSLELNAHGYGVWWNVHLSKRHIQLPAGGEQEVTELSTTESLLKRISPFFEMIVKVRSGKQTRTVNQTREVAGRQISTPVQETRDVHTLHFRGNPDSQDPSERLLTCKIPMPESIEWNSWTDFENTYNQVRSKVK